MSSLNEISTNQMGSKVVVRWGEALLRPSPLLSSGQIFKGKLNVFPPPRTDKKENQNFLIYEEIQNGAVAKSKSK